MHSKEEAARYLETYRLFENKPADMIKEQLSSAAPQDYLARVSSIFCIFLFYSSLTA